MLPGDPVDNLITHCSNAVDSQTAQPADHIPQPDAQPGAQPAMSEPVPAPHQHAGVSCGGGSHQSGPEEAASQNKQRKATVNLKRWR